MAKILVAASPEPRAIVERILAGHELFFAETLSQAVKLLGDRTFDLIICTIAFDETKMFELLGFAKSTPDWKLIPFVCARVRDYVVRSQSARAAAAFTSRQLGAAAFLDIANYPADPEQGMRDAIEGILKTMSRSART
jgi:PleD family two-component response regulator